MKFKTNRKTNPNNKTNKKLYTADLTKKMIIVCQEAIETLIYLSIRILILTNRI